MTGSSCHFGRSPLQLFGKLKNSDVSKTDRSAEGPYFKFFSQEDFLLVGVWETFLDAGSEQLTGAGIWKNEKGRIVLYWLQEDGTYEEDETKYVYVLWSSRCYLIEQKNKRKFRNILHPNGSVVPVGYTAGEPIRYHEPRGGFEGTYFLLERTWNQEVDGEPVFSDEMIMPQQAAGGEGTR